MIGRFLSTREYFSYLYDWVYAFYIAGFCLYYIVGVDA